MTTSDNAINCDYLGEIVRIAILKMNELPDNRIRLALSAIHSVWPHLDEYQQRQTPKDGRLSK